MSPPENTGRSSDASEASRILVPPGFSSSAAPPNHPSMRAPGPTVHSPVFAAAPPKSPPISGHKPGFYEGMVLLKYFKERTGHCNFPTRPKAHPLSRFVRGIRDGPNHETPWSEWMKVCREFREKHGHLCIKTNDKQLGNFCMRLRQQYKLKLEGKTTTLTNARFQELDEMGFVWLVGKRKDPAKMRPHKNWEEWLAEFQEFVAREGHPHVPRSIRDLGMWVSTQRQEYKKLKEGRRTLMTPERVELLVKAGFAFRGKYTKRRKLVKPPPLGEEAQQRQGDDRDVEELEAATLSDDSE